MDYQWAYLERFFSQHPIDYASSMELACGHGCNSERLADRAKSIVLVDVNPENILFCKKRFPDKPWRFVLNNGFGLRDIPDQSITFVYCFEAAFISILK
jgi:ubiquinone/menaquinone biosynthesis C-methylase UbiE